MSSSSSSSAKTAPDGRWLIDERRLQALRACRLVSRFARPARSFGPSSIRWSFSRTHATAAGIVSPRPVWGDRYQSGLGPPQKCTLCYDRLQSGMEPACSKACPTESIQFGTINELKGSAGKRVAATATRAARSALIFTAPIKDARRAQLVLSASRQTGSLRLAAGSEDADAQFKIIVDVFPVGRGFGRLDRYLQLPRSGRGCAQGGPALSEVPSSTFFTAPPDWGWLIVLYFFFGGLAGGCYFLAVLIDLFGHPEDRPLARLGHYISFPCLVISGSLLTVDLHAAGTLLAYADPVEHLGADIQAVVADVARLLGTADVWLFSLLSFVGALVEDGRLKWPRGQKLRPPEAVGRIISILGGIFGFYVAGYTGVLLGVTNRPIWSDTPLLGMLFVISAASISAALMILVARKYGWIIPGLAALQRIDIWVVALELIVLIAVIVSLGPVARAWLNVWGLLLLVGVIGVGMRCAAALLAGVVNGAARII